ncbi:Vacuolar-sorting protein SNF8 [Trichostrongylus colubriformis]|uniref:Vacuolar-sorting protein SNF8 n=1 Tax=Trichostrongylus colubriformis TaxID=6319 RepID=A0AAN8F0F1_TRICO
MFLEVSFWTCCLLMLTGFFLNSPWVSKLILGTIHFFISVHKFDSVIIYQFPCPFTQDRSYFKLAKVMASRRRGVGVAAVQRKQETQAKFNAKGEQMASEQLQMFSKQLEEFTMRLEQFAHRHRDEIRKNSQFRRHFQEMCASVGVDPLASGKGFWAEKLGVGDFYYELAVQIVEV